MSVGRGFDLDVDGGRSILDQDIVDGRSIMDQDVVDRKVGSGTR